MHATVITVQSHPLLILRSMGWWVDGCMPIVWRHGQAPHAHSATMILFPIFLFLFLAPAPLTWEHGDVEMWWQICTCNSLYCYCSVSIFATHLLLVHRLLPSFLRSFLSSSSVLSSSTYHFGFSPSSIAIKKMFIFGFNTTVFVAVFHPLAIGLGTHEVHI